MDIFSTMAAFFFPYTIYSFIIIIKIRSDAANGVKSIHICSPRVCKCKSVRKIKANGSNNENQAACVRCTRSQEELQTNNDGDGKLKEKAHRREYFPHTFTTIAHMYEKIIMYTNKERQQKKVHFEF